MRQVPNYGDERQLAWCVYCAGRTETRDHVPSKVLLDEPYPPNLPVVPACESCNAGFSLDEEYLACLVDCVRVGSVDVRAGHREKIRRILDRKPALVSMLARARDEANGRIAFAVETDRIRNVVLKLARGHAAYELNEPHVEEPLGLSFVPFELMDPEVRMTFESPPRPLIWPEVGSRAMQRLAVSFPAGSDWIVAQPGRYRYLAAAGESVVVRLVLSEYLACEVVWS